MRDYPEFNAFAQSLEDCAKGMINFRLKGMPVDIKDYSDKFVIEADLPGYDKSEIDVNYANGKLSISAVKKEGVYDEEKKQEAEFKYLYRERLPERNSRTFGFGRLSNVDEDKIQASFDNGVLTVVLYKKTPDNHKKNIKID